MEKDGERTGIVLEAHKDEKKFPYQQCQDPGINERFRALHNRLVNQVIAFCVENNITIDEFTLHADMLELSIKYGSWQACTDSSFVFTKPTEEYKEVMRGRKRVSKEEFRRIEEEQEPFMYSM